MKSLTQLKSMLKSLFEEQYFASLATLHGDQIHSSLVAFASAEDLVSVFICTSRSTRKFANIKKKSSVSMLIHNCENSVKDVNRAVAVTVTGKAFEVLGEKLRPVKAAYLAKQYHMGDFVSSPNTAFIEVVVESYDIVTHFQDVITLDMKSSGEAS